MNLRSFRFLADENIDYSVSDYMTAIGLDVFSVKGSHLESKPDTVLLAYALLENRIVITHDTDFTTIAYKDKAAFIGILFLQPGHFAPAFTIQTLETLFVQDISLEIPFIIVAENSKGNIRIRIRNNVAIK